VVVEVALKLERAGSLEWVELMVAGLVAELLDPMLMVSLALLQIDGELNLWL
jgi:hypothetical protein